MATGYLFIAILALLSHGALSFLPSSLPRRWTIPVLRSSNDYMNFLSKPREPAGSSGNQASSGKLPVSQFWPYSSVCLLWAGANNYAPQQPMQQPPAPPATSAQAIATTNAPNGQRPSLSFYHAPLSFFDLDLLTPKGPRKGADIGEPHDATRRIEMDERLNAGSWWCAAGGWPSSTPRDTTEVFWVMEGHGCVTDQDGTRHYFGPGDTVILPMLWTGRWDVLEPIHKVWCVHDHTPLPDVATRAIVTPYHQLADASVPSGGESFATLFETSYTRVGCTTYPAGSAYNQNNPGATEWWHILEGVMYLTDGADGSAQRCVPGDTVVVPAGWNGHADIMEPVKKLWVQVAN